MEQILHGKPVAEFIDQKTLSFLNSLPKDKEKVHMTAITVGDNPASLLYVSRKKDKAVELGIDFHWEKLNADTSQTDLNRVIAELSENTDGLIVQLPLPDHLDVVETINQIPVELDVDGLTTQNLGMLFSEKQILLPATTQAVLEMLSFYNIDTFDKNIVIAGRSRLVSAPLARVLSSKQFNANVTVIHSKTSNQKEFILNSDIFISAIGRAKMFDQSYFKPGCVVIDIGISNVDGKTYGDIDSTNLETIAKYRAPYPGGVGPITVSALFYNLTKLVS